MHAVYVPIFPTYLMTTVFLTAERPDSLTEILHKKFIIGKADENRTENNLEVKFMSYINFM